MESDTPAPTVPIRFTIPAKLGGALDARLDAARRDAAAEGFIPTDNPGGIPAWLVAHTLTEAIAGPGIPAHAFLRREFDARLPTQLLGRLDTHLEGRRADATDTTAACRPTRSKAITYAIESFLSRTSPEDLVGLVILHGSRPSAGGVR